MADFILSLGGVAFLEFEVPPEIKAGGKQALFLHKYAGGARTADTQGPDDDPLQWQGIFMDQTAQARCRQIDTMRRQGLPIALVWSGYNYTVIIESFTWDFKKFWYIPYEIKLAVVQDNTQPSPQPPVDTEGQMQTDASSAASSSSNLPAIQQTYGPPAPTNYGPPAPSNIGDASNATNPMSGVGAANPSYGQGNTPMGSNWQLEDQETQNMLQAF